jgi:23S rRNA pseudouridine2605 synthase
MWHHEAMEPRPRILLFHKPKGCTVTASDELERSTVYDRLPAWVRSEGWVPVGRLDMDSRGLLLFVREGHLVDLLTRPGALSKVYEVWVRGAVQPSHLALALSGVSTPIGELRCKEAKVLGMAGGKTRLRVVLDEGKNRHLRRLFGTLRDERHGTPLKVTDLKRTAFGPIALDVPSGAWRFLTPEEERVLVGETDRP